MKQLSKTWRWIILREIVMKRKTQAFIAIGVLIAIAAFLLATKVAPWFYAINTRVRLHMDAPADTSIRICWDERRNECLPFVPYVEAEQRIAKESEFASLWLSELPPRPMYYISLEFKSGTQGVVIHELELDSSKLLLWGWLPGIGIQNTIIGASQFEVEDLTYTIQDGSYYIDGNSGSQLLLPWGIKAGSAVLDDKRITMVIWGLLFSTYLILAIPLYFVPFAIQNLGIASKITRPTNYPWWVYVLCGIGIILMLLLVTNSAVLLHQFDPMFYLHLAAHEEWITPARPPGYQMFVALALWMSNYHLDGVVLLQAVFLALSAAICTWMLRKWLHPWIAVLFMFFVLFSPAQVHWARWIMRDSLFAGLVLLAMATAIAHFTAETKQMAWTWLAVFSIICGIGFLIRENGILLPVVLLPVLFARSIQLFTSPGKIWKRIESVFLLFVRYIPAVLVVGAAYIGLSSYNYLHYGYFQATLHVTSHHFSWQEIGTATFDPRSLLKPDPAMNDTFKTYLGQSLYRSFLMVREKTPGDDPIYTSFFPTINQTLIENGQAANWFFSASVIDEIGRSSKMLMPWEAELAGTLRQYRELLIQTPRDVGGYPIASDDAASLVFKQQLLEQLPKKVVYTGKAPEPDSLIGKYYSATEDYAWYWILVFVALLLSLYVLRYEDPIFLTPIVFYVANDILLVVMRTVNTRYVMSLDVLLILQVALGLSCLIYRYSPVVLQKEVRLENTLIRN
jgi:hypothetical protein